MKTHYIKAVLEMIKAGKTPDEILTGLAKVLKDKGHERLKASVLHGVLRILEADSDRLSSVVVVAKATDTARYEAAIKTALAQLTTDPSYTVVEDDTLIGGFIAKANNTTYDASYKTKLVKLYRNLTT